MVLLKQLIEQIKGHPCLWNRKLEEYRNHCSRDDAWDSIAQALDKPAKDLKAEWKKLQDSYRQAMFRRKTKFRQGAKRMRPWRYEQEMSFLQFDPLPQENPASVAITQEDEESKSVFGFIKEEEIYSESERDCSTPKSTKDWYLSPRSDDNEHADTSRRKKSEPGELDYFFKSICESTKHLPRNLQLKVKGEIMKIVLDAEVEHLNAE